MVEQFLSYCKANNLISDGQKTLIAISGGADSVVLSHLLYTSNLPFALAHCNFALRGEQSNADEAFVRDLALQYKCELFIEHFDTVTFSIENKLSIEMAARKLRYDWFQKICLQHNFDLLATAHHQEDNAETIMLNLIRGTGIRGLIGIKNKTANIIRPLLFANKAMILSYVQENNLSFRTDESNNELIYKRNKLRNVVFPILKELNPSVVKTINENANRISQSFLFYEKNIKTLHAQIITITPDNTQKINILELLQTGFSELLLFEWLHPFGFIEDTINNIISTSSVQSGKRFIGGNYELIKDREHFILSRIQEELPSQTIFADTKNISSPITLKIEQCLVNSIDLKNITESMAMFDISKIAYPLTVRSWVEGDFFMPLGMKKHKKLSDFFIDKKLSLHDKKRALVLEDNNGEILWVIGYRISEKVKITSETSTALKLEIVN